MKKLLVFVKKVLLYLAIVVALIVAVLLGINAYLVWRNGARLEAQLAELRAAGEPTSLKDLARAPIPPEENAATFLRRAENDIKSIYEGVNKLEKQIEAAREKAFQESLEKGEMGNERSVGDWSYRSFSVDARQYSAAERAMAQKIFDAHPNAIPLLEQAAACRDYDPQIDYTLPAQAFINKGLDRAIANRAVARVLRARTALLLAKGRRDDALAGMILLFRLCLHFDHEPLVFGYLCALTCRGIAVDGANAVLQSGPVGAESREALHRHLARHDVVQAYIRALKSDRAVALDATSTFPWHGSWLTRGVLEYPVKLGCLDMIQEHLEWASRPYYDVKPTEPAAKRRSLFTPPHAVILEELRPPFDGTRTVMEQDRAMVRALWVLNALQVKAAPDAKEPPELSDLGLPPEATIDPFNGQPLHVKKLPQGWLVYSVGKNLVDDGGKIESQADIGVGPPGCEQQGESK